MDDSQILDKAIALFPATFGLVAFPKAVFRVCRALSYVSGETAMLYTERQTAAGAWTIHAKGTPRELGLQIDRRVPR